MEALNECVKSGKTRYIGCSTLHPYQLLKANMIARQHGWAEFISVQNHYNIIYREDERELTQLVEEEGMSMTPYSPLAGGRVCRLPEEKTTRFQTFKLIKYLPLNMIMKKKMICLLFKELKRLLIN